MRKQRRSTKRVGVASAWVSHPQAPRSKSYDTRDVFLCSLTQEVFKHMSMCHLHSFRESKKSGGKKDEKKRKSAGGEKEKERGGGGGNDSFKSREFIETSEESSSGSEHKSKSKSKRKKKVKLRSDGHQCPADCSRIHYPRISIKQHSVSNASFTHNLKIVICA